MARYSDEAYTMISDSREKKSVAASAFKQRTHCGKGGSVKFPSDYLSKKELKSMNGECIKYASLKKPMTWEQFKALPDDLKKEYIKGLREKFNVPDKEIAAMFDVQATSTLQRWFKCLGLSKGMGSGARTKTWNKEGWLAWLHGVDETAVLPSETPVETVEAENMVVIETEGVADVELGETTSASTIETAEGENIVDDICEKVMKMIDTELDEVSHTKPVLSEEDIWTTSAKVNPAPNYEAEYDRLREELAKSEDEKTYWKSEAELYLHKYSELLTVIKTLEFVYGRKLEM